MAVLQLVELFHGDITAITGVSGNDQRTDPYHGCYGQQAQHTCPSLTFVPPTLAARGFLDALLSYQKAAGKSSNFAGFLAKMMNPPILQITLEIFRMFIYARLTGQGFGGICAPCLMQIIA